MSAWWRGSSYSKGKLEILDDSQVSGMGNSWIITHITQNKGKVILARMQWISFG